MLPGGRRVCTAGFALPMTISLSAFSELAGVALHYDRDTQDDYGSRGRPISFRADSEFVARLDACFAELWMLSAHGRAEVITSAGAYTRKPGQHGTGRAFDLDGIFWRRRSFVTLSDGYYGDDRFFYFGIECVLRRHFGQVLNYEYDNAHRDHFHVDDGQPVGFRPDSRSLILFLQGTLTHVYKQCINIDGVWSNETSAAVERVLASLGITGELGAVEVWLTFLLAGARIALGAA
jgi:hypothetical protein